MLRFGEDEARNLHPERTSHMQQVRKEGLMNTSAWAAPGTTMPAPSRWALVGRGILAILFGFLVWVWPGMSLLVFTFMFGIFAIAGGIFALVSAVQAGKQHERWWLLAAAGVVSIVIGILAFVWPVHTAVVLLYLIAIWAIVTGILEIASAFRSREAAIKEWLLILGGVVSIIFGALLLAFPGVGLLALLWLVGLWAVVYGIMEIMHAFTSPEYRKQQPPAQQSPMQQPPPSGTVPA
jgi:uncharacterized membrane protein HdeD (DUF308 family)